MNSFLVEAGRTENRDPEEILYVKLNQERKEKFRLLTRIVRENGEVRAEKEAMVSQAEEFVEKLEKTGTEGTGSDKYKNLPCRAENGKISYPLLTGKTLHQEIAELAQKEDLEEIKALLKKFYQEFSGLVRLWITGPESSARYLVIIREERITNVSARPMWT